MRTSDDLIAELIEILGSENVYFQPPASVKLSYPCFVMELSNTYTRRADNKAYNNINRYSITHIFKSLSKELKDEVLNHFEMVSHDNRQIVDGLYHDYFTLYY